MKNWTPTFFASVAALFLALAFGSAPAQAADTTVACSQGGSFTITGTTVTRSTADCAGEVSIPANVTEISDRAFEFRAGVTGLVFEAGSALTRIGYWGFHGTSISSVDLPDGLDIIEWWAFAETHLTTLSVPGTVTSFDDDMFRSPTFTNLIFEPRIASSLYLGAVIFNESPNATMTFMGPYELNPTYNWNRNPVVVPGYTWKGWSTSPNGPIVTFPLTIASPSTTLYQVRTPSPHVVNFDSQGGSSVAPGSFITGGAIESAPAAPSREDSTFAAWTTSTGGIVTFPYAPGGIREITLYATWTPKFAASFNSTGGTAVQGKWFAASEIIASAPQAPTRRGYTFAGWSATNNGSPVAFPYDPGVTNDITLYALWTKNTYAVTFNSNSGEDVLSQSFTVTNPIPFVGTTRRGYTFAGWSATNGGSTSVAFPYTPWDIRDITLYAIWEKNNYAVTFNVNGGAAVPAGSFTVADPIAFVGTTRRGYTFAGWSATNGGSTSVAFPYDPGVTNAITLYALWTKNTYAVTFNSNGGAAVPAGSFTVVDPLESVTPIRVGYTFDGWSATDGGTAVSFPYDPGVLEAITLYAKWVRDPFKPELIAGDVISGTGIQSTILTSAGGSWLAYPEAAVSHQWYRCASAVPAGLSALPTASKCVKITGATLGNYKVVVADAGKYLTTLIEAKNRIGSTFLTVATFRAPPLKAPTKIELPVGTGTAKANAQLTGTVGTWAGNPVPKTSVQWFRCEKDTKASAKPVPGSSQCQAISGATKANYKLKTADKGKFVTIQITAKNSEGTAVSTAKAQHVILEPNSVDAPVISGSATLNRSLKTNKGTWLAFPTATTSIQWYRCNKSTSAGAKKFSGSSGCKAISGATGSRYTVKAEDAGKYISVLVKAVNSGGTKSVTAQSTDKVQ